MGDKTQLFVIGLSSKHKTATVLLGIGIATVALNIMGVFMGNILSKIIPMEYVTLGSGFFFLIFALLTIGKSEEETVTGGKSVLGIATAFFLAELGDKTQLSAIAFSASTPGHGIAVFLGATCGMLIADAIGILIAKVMQRQIPEKIMKAAAYVIFTFFGFKTLLDNFYIFLPGKGIPLTITIAMLYAFFSFIMLKGKKKMC